VLYATTVAKAGLDPRISTELAGYRIDALAGRGGMGVVYRAHHLHLDRRVALKVLVPELAEDEGFRERFLRESRVAASIDHRGVIPIYDAGEAEGVLYIAMRYVDGTDLRSLLTGAGQLEPQRALAIVGQVAGALDAAHARGLVHRDVKPANILIAEEAGEEIQVYLSDFGLTKATGSGPSLTGTGQFVGTVEYAAPEQIEGQPLDGRSDQYSLACVLQECLAGEPPFVRESQLAMLFAHVTDAPTPPSSQRPELPVELDSVLGKGLAKDPADRYGSCRELVTAAREALGISSGVHLEPTRETTAAPAARRGRWLVLIAVVTALVAAAAVVAILLASRGDGGETDVPTTVTENTLSSIDPETNTFASTLEVGARPQTLAIGPDGIWVANFGSRTVVRVEPQTNTAGTPIGSGGTPTGIAVGEGAVWVTNSFDGVVTRIDPERNAIDDSIPTGSGSEAIAVGEGSVWVADSLAGTLLRIDPATNEPAEPIPVGESPTGVAVGGGSVWVANSGDSTVSRVHPGTGEVVETIPLRFAPDAIAFGPSGVWVTNSQDDSVSRIDPATNRVALTVPVGDGPAGLAVGNDAVWVANLLGGTISRIDTAAASPTVVATITVGAGPDGVAIGDDGTVWFTAHAP
jgi:YVTN family beta-propeller protein